MKNDNVMEDVTLTPEDKGSDVFPLHWKGDTGIKTPNPVWEWNTVEMNIPKEFIRKLRENYKNILGEIDHMNEDHALAKFDEALIRTLLED